MRSRRSHAGGIARLPFAILVALTFGSLPVHPVLAQQVRIAWDSPGGGHSKSFTTGPVDVVVTLTGQSLPIVGLAVQIQFRTPRPLLDPFPDAWRFDDEGCQAGRVCVEVGGADHLLPDTGVPGYRYIAGFTRTASPDWGRAFFAEEFPAPVVPDPTRTYTLMRMRFDHTFSVADSAKFPGQCGDGGRVLWIVFSSTGWLGPAGSSGSWTWADNSLGWNSNAPWARIGDSLASGPGAAGDLGPLFGGEVATAVIPPCDVPVPAARATWGRLKSAYR